jgi:hypothetical protein
LPAWWNIPARTARVIDIFERLELREREAQMIRLASAEAHDPSSAEA